MNTRMQKAVRFLEKEPAIWGPLFLLCSVIIGVKSQISFDLLLTASIGFFLSLRLRIRGFCYALIILSLTSIFKHAFLTDDHLWHLGVEVSLGLAFFITALASLQGAEWIEALESQIQTGKASYENLEEELSKVHEDSAQQQIAFQERIERLQKELEELQTEHSSILILNEVLRKKTKSSQEISEEASGKYLSAKAKLEILRAQLEENQKELERALDTDQMASLNKQLMEELNDARVEKEQALMTNETLSRFAYKESLKVKEADEEIVSLKSLLRAAHQEVRNIREPMEERIEELTRANQALTAEFDKVGSRANQQSEQLLRLNSIQTERNFLKERLDHALYEIELLKKQDPQAFKALQKELRDVKEREHVAQMHVSELAQRLSELEKQQPTQDPHQQEMLKHAQVKLSHLSEIEPLYKQLKKQFEEKNKVLEETRQNLFKVDTELQKYKMDQASLELSPLSKELEQEFESLSRKISELEEENLQLQELVTELSKSVAAQKKK